jgi:hypothetical protein
VRRKRRLPAAILQPGLAGRAGSSGLLTGRTAGGITSRTKLSETTQSASFNRSGIRESQQRLFLGHAG